MCVRSSPGEDWWTDYNPGVHVNVCACVSVADSTTTAGTHTVNTDDPSWGSTIVVAVVVVVASSKSALAQLGPQHRHTHIHRQSDPQLVQSTSHINTDCLILHNTIRNAAGPIHTHIYA